MVPRTREPQRCRTVSQKRGQESTESCSGTKRNETNPDSVPVRHVSSSVEAPPPVNESGSVGQAQEGELRFEGERRRRGRRKLFRSPAGRAIFLSCWISAQRPTKKRTGTRAPVFELLLLQLVYPTSIVPRLTTLAAPRERFCLIHHLASSRLMPLNRADPFLRSPHSCQPLPGFDLAAPPAQRRSQPVGLEVFCLPESFLLLHPALFLSPAFRCERSSDLSCSSGSVGNAISAHNPICPTLLAAMYYASIAPGRGGCQRLHSFSPCDD